MKQTIIFYIILFGVFILPPYYAKEASPLVFLGEADLTLYFFDIYHAKLYGETKQATLEQHLELELTYRRNFDGRDIANQSAKELYATGEPQINIDRWLPMMEAIFPSIQKGDKIRAIYHPNRGIRFLFNGQKDLGEVKDPQFAKSFMGIWLSPKTTQPEMRLKLFGLK